MLKFAFLNRVQYQHRDQDMSTTKNYKESPKELNLLKSPILDEVIGQIKATPNSGKLDITSTIGISNSVIKYDVLTFRDNGVLILEAVDAEFIAIAIKRLVLDFTNPYQKAYITRPVGLTEDTLVEKLAGATGRNGVNGRDGSGEVNRQGNPGEAGESGHDGLPGETLILPYLYIFVQEITFGAAIEPGRQYIDINYSGFTGGNGGDGGKGGNGGRGANGKEGATSGFDCKGRAGHGGRGGDAGQGGQGGTGSMGGRMLLFAPDKHTFDFVNGIIEGGEPGRPGRGGNPGIPGRGGFGGSRNGWCGPGGKGVDGRYADPPSLGEGLPGSQGARGQQIIQSRNNSDLF